jgi:hypothetical protein
MLIAERKGIRSSLLRSKRLIIKTGFLSIFSIRQSGTLIPADLARSKATASHKTTLYSSSFLGNLAIARVPSLS